MTKNLLRVFPFFSTLFFLSLSPLLYSSGLATSDPLLEDSLEWKEEPSVSIGWQALISFDALFIFCVLAWILYTYCRPQKVWRVWQKLFAFPSMSNTVENRKSFKLAESRFNASIPNKNNKRQLRWMHVGKAK